MNLDNARESRIGLDGYCAILASIIVAPQTAAQLAERFGVRLRTMTWICCSLFRAELVHRSAWVKAGARTKHLPVWSWGADGDVPHPHWRPVSRKASQSAILLQSVRDALEDRPQSSKDLAADLGFTWQHTNWLLRILKAHRLIRVASWDVRETGVHVGLLAFGPGRPAARLALVGRSPGRAAVFSRRHREKSKMLRMLHLTAGPIDLQIEAA